VARHASRRERLVRQTLVIAPLVVLIGGIGWWVGLQIWAGSEYRAAEGAMARRDYAEARQRLAHCLRVWPSDGQTLLLAARAADRDGDSAEAVRLLDAAAQEVPDAVVLERKVLRLRSGDLTDAHRHFAACDEHRDRPESKLILEGLVEGSLKAQQLEFARRCLALWEESQTDPRDRAQAKAWRGEIAYWSGYADIALVQLREAVEAAPANVAARLRLAEVLIQYTPADAKGHLEALRAKRPEDRAVLIRLASCHRALGEHEQAVRLLNELLVRDGRDVPALLERGRVALDLRKLDEAEGWLRGAEALAPEHREVRIALARCLQLAGKAAEAQVYLDRVVKADAPQEERAR
jgi:tetratricopeptide (TPR) repeat protein